MNISHSLVDQRRGGEIRPHQILGKSQLPFGGVECINQDEIFGSRAMQAYNIACQTLNLCQQIPQRRVGGDPTGLLYLYRLRQVRCAGLL